MTNDRHDDAPDKIRKEAMRRLKDKHKPLSEMALDDVESMVHELEVQQVELEVQNEELRRVQHQLAEARDRYRDLYEHAPVGYLTVDASAVVEQANRTAVHMCDREYDELVGHRLERLVSPEDRDRCYLLLRQAGTPEGRAVEEFRLQRPDRLLMWVHAEAVADANASGKPAGYRVTFTDITRSQLLEQQLRQTHKMEAIGQLAGGIAHDFNNQLAGIIGYSEVLVQRLAEPDLKDFAGEILGVARRTARLVSQLLDFSSQGRHRSMPVNLHTLVEETTDILRRTLDRRIHIVRKLDASPASTQGDPSQIKTVLLNLAANARDAMPEGGKLIFDTRVVHLDKAHCSSVAYDIAPGDYLRLNVTDTGTGMDRKTLERVFDPFYTTKDTGRGTGMGLAAVYGIVKSHQGAVNVYSTPGRGTTFSIDLPLCEDIEEETYTPRPIERLPSAPRVMVVDDETVFCHLMSELLSTAGCTVTSFEDSVEAVEYFRANHGEIDLVVLDLIMPKLGGPEVFEKLRETDPGVKVLLVSGYSLNDEVQALLNAGAEDFLQKPFPQEDLMRTVAHILDVKP